MRKLLLLLFTAHLFVSCSVSKKLSRSAQENVLSSDALKTAHVGISVYEPATGKYWFNYQGDKYFVPASNTKIPTCYAAMKYLGDSLVGLRYDDRYKNEVVIKPSGDPTLLHPDFKSHPVFQFLKNKKKVLLLDSNWKEQAWGSGWSWNDYDAAYLAERSPLPVYGNVVHLQKARQIKKQINDSLVEIKLVDVLTFPSYFQDSVYNDSDEAQVDYDFSATRDYIRNIFRLNRSSRSFSSTELPFLTYGLNTAQRLLEDTLKINFSRSSFGPFKFKVLHSQPTDSLLRPMMHRSDNFFAEQSLLMVSNELLGYMNDEKIIDTLLKTDFKDLPQKPRWVDGSGLSRYNLFTPQDFVFILNKMKNEFGMTRIKNILATGNEGTLRNYYVKEKDFIYAKTGTLSGVVALSGFLTTKKGKDLIFSVQVNNHQGSASDVRRAVEKFIEGIHENF